MQSATRVLAHGGRVSYKNNPDGSQSPYELNIVYYDALNDPAAVESQSTQVDRFLASQAILLGLRGVPGIYVHSLFGSRNWTAGVDQTGHNRTINRRKFQRDELLAELDDSTSVPHQVFTRYKRLIAVRTAEAAFHPIAPQTLLRLDPRLFAFARTRVDGSARLLCLVNVTDASILPVEIGDVGFGPGAELVELVAGRPVVLDATGHLPVPLAPYQALWLLDKARD